MLGAILKTKWKFKILIKRRKESEERLESESVMCNESQCRGLFLLHHLWEITKPLGIQGIERNNKTIRHPRQCESASLIALSR